MVERREQERAEPSALGISPGQPALGQQSRKESLRQILGIGGGTPLVPHMRVNRIPIGAAQTIQRGGRVRRVILRRQGHEAPLSRVHLPLRQLVSITFR